MSKKDTDNLDDLRERLYSRGDGAKPREQYELSDEPIEVKKSWREKAAAAIPTIPSPQSATQPEPAPVAAPTNPRRRSYRKKLLLIGLGFFTLSILASSLFILWGGNSISGENISISVTGPFTVGGGETMSLQVGITNHNSIDIESATLIVEYPIGTQSADEPGQELLTERLPLSNIASGETVNVPLEAQVFGEENQELTIRASVEYRVRGSNATFYKEAEPLRFKIGSSPVVLSVDAERNLSSGQETEITLTVSSNSPSSLSDILIRAEYPSGFQFRSSNPSPVSGQNIWNVSDLEPEEEAEIVITGVVTGTESEAHVMNFSVGVPNERDRFSLASIFATASTEFLLEEPFLNVILTVNDKRDDVVSIEPGEISTISVQIENTLSSNLYDGVVEIRLSGNALSDADVSVNGGGYYDSNTKTVVWDTSSRPSLAQILPGGSEILTFRVRPDINTSITPEINMSVAVRAKRLSDSQAEDALVGTINGVLRVDSGIGFSTEVTRSTASFSDSGPVPPEVGETTTYTIVTEVNNGSNPLTNGSVTATLPSYVNWTGNTAGQGTWNYNSTSRTVEWQTGEIPANDTVIGGFQVSILPSVSQVGTTPTLVGEQRFRATDKFTGSEVSAKDLSINTRLGEDRDTGVVQE